MDTFPRRHNSLHIDIVQSYPPLAIHPMLHMRSCEFKLRMKEVIRFNPNLSLHESAVIRFAHSLGMYVPVHLRVTR